MEAYTNIYIIRHGQTDWNKLEKIQGHDNNFLNEKGRRDSLANKEYINHINFDKIYVTPLVRTIETAKLMLDLDDNNIPVFINKNLIERNFGAISGKHPEYYYNLFHSTNTTVENDDQLYNRTSNELFRVFSEAKQNDYLNVALFCHSHVIKAILTNLEPKRFSMTDKLENSVIYKITFLYNKQNIDSNKIDIPYNSIEITKVSK